MICVLWWARPNLYRELRFPLVLMNVVGFVVFWLYPVAPPRMLPGYVDTVSVTNAIGSWHSGQLAQAANEFAAMPSLHIAWACWCYVAIRRAWPRQPWATVAAVAHVALTVLCVIATANHYVLDVVAGAATAAACFAAWQFYVSLRQRRSDGVEAVAS
jgi:membrane-associated phospholipid phosphatase